MRALVRVVGEDAGHVLVLHVWFVPGVPGADRYCGVPTLSAIARAAHVDPVATGAVSPVRRSSKLVERQVRDVGVSFVIECGGHITSSTPIRRGDHTSGSEGPRRVERVRSRR